MRAVWRRGGNGGPHKAHSSPPESLRPWLARPPCLSLPGEAASPLRASSATPPSENPRCTVAGPLPASRARRAPRRGTFYMSYLPTMSVHRGFPFFSSAGEETFWLANISPAVRSEHSWTHLSALCVIQTHLRSQELLPLSQTKTRAGSLCPGGHPWGTSSSPPTPSCVALRQTCSVHVGGSVPSVPARSLRTQVEKGGAPWALLRVLSFC